MSIIDREEVQHFQPPGNLDDEARLSHDAGSYKYLCGVGGHVVFTHAPIGTVLHIIRRCGS